MEEMTRYFTDIIEQVSSIDMAEAEFRRALVDDPDLRRKYREYCREVGSSEKNGFLDFCEEYMEAQDGVWDALSDLDNQE